jgi:hypothetical protein
MGTSQKLNTHWVNGLCTHIKEGLQLRNGEILAKFEEPHIKLYKTHERLRGQVRVQTMPPS